MTRKFPHVSSPITIGRTTFRNRIFSAPMGGTDITNDGCIGPKSTAFYELRAKGGAAAVTVSELMVHPQTDGSHAYHLDESILNSLAAATYTADAIRRHGAIPSLELSHSGQFAGTYMTDKSRQHGLCQWGPSEGMRPDGVPVKALTQELIDDIVKAYGHAAGLAKRAGFEMVMITAATAGSSTSSSRPCSITAATDTAAPWKTASALPSKSCNRSAPLSAPFSPSNSA